jgi:rRNA maturation RNase YbeY
MNKESSIWFFTEDIRYTFRGKGATRAWVINVIREEGYLGGDINIIFCSDAFLHEINVKYLKHNTLTDIITFDLSEREKEISGDIYISIERARENAKGLKVTLFNEVRRLIVHGILHLAGYRDKSPAEKAAMTQKEDYYLSLPAE